jgi:hypothetical protein
MRVVVASQGTMFDFPLHTCVKALIARGAEVNAIDYAGQTVLMRTHGNALISGMLKRAGAKK